MVKGFLKRIQKSVADAYDPNREERIRELAARLFEGLKAKRQQFCLEAEIAEFDVSKSDVTQAAQAAFRHLLDIVWKDGVVTKKEKETIDWVVNSLKLSVKDAMEIQKSYAIEQFRSSLARAMADGALSDREFQLLEHIASAIGSTAPKIAREYFYIQCEGLLQSQFLSATSGGQFGSTQWEALSLLSTRFGFSGDDLARIIRHPASQFVEHTLADAKADAALTAQEREYIEWLLTTFALGGDFAAYVRREMTDFEIQCNISQGRLPSIIAPDCVELRAGEIVHACVDADLIIEKRLKSGITHDSHRGMIILLDSRAIFQSATRAHSMNYRSFIALGGDTTTVMFQLNNKPVWSLRLVEDNPWFLLIFRKAVALANQTATRAADGAPSRHISRDVRQRVWQRYGGQCVDCGARDYLEFDHIIPVAKGGSNLDGNIQLLCRRCNLKKSDHI